MTRTTALALKIRRLLHHLFLKEIEDGKLNYPDANSVQDIIDDSYLIDLAQVILDNENGR